MRKIATIVASIVFTFAAVAAGVSEKSTPAAEYDGPVSMTVAAVPAAVYDGPVSTSAPAHDYKLERESCCGPQQ